MANRERLFAQPSGAHRPPCGPWAGGQVLLSARFCLYGETAEAAAAREEPLWQEWIGERFPAGEVETGS